MKFIIALFTLMCLLNLCQSDEKTEKISLKEEIHSNGSSTAHRPKGDNIFDTTSQVWRALAGRKKREDVDKKETVVTAQNEETHGNGSSTAHRPKGDNIFDTTSQV